jgi:diguanylate cyclase (GGDEF)-like protein
LKPIWYFGQPSMPLRALLLSLTALLVPIVATLLLPEQEGSFEVLFWLTSLLPAFFLAYYQGWKGVSIALALGMIVLVAMQIILRVGGGRITNWPLVVAITVAFIGISLAVGVLSELLHRERMRAEQLALTDELTGISNRRHLRLFLDTEFSAAGRGRPLVVVFFDLDAFKQYNDTHGHEAGDQALTIFAEVLRSQTRTMNLSARLGGEEFVSVLSSAEIPGALVFVQRVKDKLRDTRLPAGTLTVTAGLAAYHPGMKRPEDLLAAADQAMYAIKKERADAVGVYEPPVEAGRG